MSLNPGVDFFFNEIQHLSSVNICLMKICFLG